jgi:hypothetical protein
MINELATLILQLDDPEFVAADIVVAVTDIAYCDRRYADAIEFASDLRTRLQHYIRSPQAAASARLVLLEQCAWWRMALGTAFARCRWPVAHGQNGAIHPI